jgi:hypothetical protein
MKKSNRRIVAKLGKLCRYLNKLESDPEMYGCATVIRKSRILAQQINEDLSATKCNSVTTDKVFTVGKYLVDVLLLLEKLKNYFVSYKQSFYGHEYGS